jgi:type IV pilus assembly protein PilB
MGENNLVADLALLKLFVRAGVLTNDAAQEAEVELAKGSGTAIDWIERKGILREEEAARLIAQQLHLPYVNLAAQALNTNVTKLIKEDLAMRFSLLALRAPEGNVVIATANPLNRAALRAVEFSTGRRVHAEVAIQSAVRDALQHAYHMDEALDSYLKGIPDATELPVAESADDRADIGGITRESTLPPVVKLLNVILLEGIRNRASDVHIEPNLQEVRVRLRIDGVLVESFRLPKWIQDPLTARCKVLAKLDITERRIPQDGRINLRYGDSYIDLRLSSLPTQFGEKVTMRILDPSNAPKGLDGRGLSDRDLKAIRQAIGRPEGMVLVTGPTGSGKSTTLYAMLAEMVSPTTNIVTIENPIEYQLRGVNQVQINEKQGLTFASTLRSILRQDPDVILVGEIRDNETAEIALRAAQTGHLVLSTLHTNDSVATVTRLIDLGIEPFMLASSLHLVMAQRLVRRICPRCAEPYEPDLMALRTLQIDSRGHRFLRGRGCGACRKSGYAGRVGIFEVMPVTRPLAALIESKASEGALRAQAREDGMRSLAECATTRVLEGCSTAEEVLQVVDVDTDTARCPTCDREVEQAFALCPHCATPLRCTCSSCGMQLQKEWQLCPYCGTGNKQGGSPAPEGTSGTRSRAVALPSAVPLLGESIAGRQYRALVVDDQPDMRHLVVYTLEHSNLPISTIEAADGREALALAQDAPPDLIVLDVMMPVMDGFEVCERLRANVRTAFVPILILTAKDDASSRARGFLAGTDDYIAKPFARTELLARVRRLLERTYGATFEPEPVTGKTGAADGSGGVGTDFLRSVARG